MLFDIKMALPSLSLSDLLFGPMLAVVFRRHPVFPPELAIEIGEVGKATVVRYLSNGHVSLSQELARVAKAKVDQCFDESTTCLTSEKTAKCCFIHADCFGYFWNGTRFSKMSAQVSIDGFNPALCFARILKVISRCAQGAALGVSTQQRQHFEPGQ